MKSPFFVRRPVALAAFAVFGFIGSAALAQTPPDPSPTPSSPETPAAQVPPAPPGPDAPSLPETQRVEIQGTRANETQERRSATASKIVIGREELDKFGDQSVSEVMKRLPGVSTDGRPGRGGGVRMRGLGSGYTQILLDGEPLRGGLSLDSIAPDQIERIEILRAPTAETGARAIAGTINIITREGYVRRANELRVGLNVEQGLISPNAMWQRSDTFDQLSTEISASVMSGRSRDASDDLTTSATGATLAQTTQSQGRRVFGGVRGKLQWKLGGGDSFTLTPSLNLGQNRSDAQMVWQGQPVAPVFASGSAQSSSRFANLRLGTQWRTTLGDGSRLELRGNLGASRSSGDSSRQSWDAAGALAQTVVGSTTSRENNASLSGKWSTLLADDHSLVAGLELEAARRSEACTRSVDGLADAYTCLSPQTARTERVALYAQDEATLSPQWSGYAGLRWEGIRVRADAAAAPTLPPTLPQDAITNRSSVWSPMFHLLWRPAPKSADQVRLSLTRSYRSAPLDRILARPSINADYPPPLANSPTAADATGNPDLRPELASGIDLAWEHYFAAGGMVSASAFYRRVTDVIRSVTTEQTVPWSSMPRWVSQPQNFDRADTAGIELEAKMRWGAWAASSADADLIPLDLRVNVSLYRSRVSGVPGPDNRMDQQPDGTLNLGADYSFTGTPWTAGANWGYTPGYTTRLSATQWLIKNRKQVLDAYVGYKIGPDARLRFSLANLVPENAITTREVAGEVATSSARTYMNARLQLEMKL